MKSDNSCVINVVSFAQIALKNIISQARSASAHAQSWALTVSIATGTSNGSCSDALTLPINYWLFHSEGGASCDRAAILSVAFFPHSKPFIGSMWRHNILSPPFLCPSHICATCQSIVSAATTTKGRSTKHSQKVHKVIVCPYSKLCCAVTTVLRKTQNYNFIRSVE